MTIWGMHPRNRHRSMPKVNLPALREVATLSLSEVVRHIERDERNQRTPPAREPLLRALCTTGGETWVTGRAWVHGFDSFYWNTYRDALSPRGSP